MQEISDQEMKNEKLDWGWRCKPGISRMLLLLEGGCIMGASPLVLLPSQKVEL